jgi:hypothetical protein
MTSASSAAALRSFAGVFGADSQSDSAARRELRRNDHFARCAGFDEIVKNAVRDRFIKRVLVAIRGEIEFQRLAFNAQTVWNIIDVDPGEIGLTSNRTHRSEIIRLKMDPVIASGCRIWKSIEARLGRRGRQFCVAVSEQSKFACPFCFCHGGKLSVPRMAFKRVPW